MYLTFKEKLKEIEKLYDDKDYNLVVVESAKIIEKAIGVIFMNFHSSLKDTKERLIFCEFEKQNGDKYLHFLKQPTIGVAIGYYSVLLKDFKDHEWLKQELRAVLNNINTIRNANVHATNRKTSDNEAGEIIDNAEKFLNTTGICDKPFEDIGFPLKYYLVYTSINTKFKGAEFEDDFKKIINDSIKLMPHFFHSVLNKAYPFLNIDEKEKLIRIYGKQIENKELDKVTKYFLSIFNEINLFAHIKGGDNLKNSLEAIFSEDIIKYNRRETRHYLIILETVFNHIHNKATDSFLEFANYVKRRYLENSKITETDQIILNDRAKELYISNRIAEQIIEKVVKTIETDLILFQTLQHEGISKFGQHSNEPELKHDKERKKKSNIVYIVFTSVIIFLLSIAYIYIPQGEYSSYELAYFKGEYKKAIEEASKDLDIKNTKAHYFYLFSLNQQDEIPDDIRSNYKKLYNENPNSPQANFYLGMIYYLSPKWRTERDSSWILIENANILGLQDKYLSILSLHQSKSLSQTDDVIQKINVLEDKYFSDPYILFQIAGVHNWPINDTAKAREYYEKAIHICPDLIFPYYQLANFYMDKKDYTAAEKILNKGLKINPKHHDLIRSFAKLYEENGEFNEAEKYLLNAMRNFGEKDIKLYYSLIDIYLKQDKIQEGYEMIDKAFIQFPRDKRLLYYKGKAERRQRWLTEEKERMEKRQLIPWLEDYEKAVEKAKRENKPILIDFYTTWCYWCKYLESETYPDSAVQVSLSNYIPVKINAEIDIELAKKYKIRSFPTLLVVSNEGDEISKIDGYKKPKEFNELLNVGLKLHDRLLKGKSISIEKYTEVSNFEDAIIIASAKHIPIMAIIGAQNSEYTDSLKNITLTDPTFQSEFNEIVYLYLDQKDCSKKLKEWNVITYPTILFMNEKGEVILHKYGYQPPEILVEVLKDIKDSYYLNKVPKTEINWIFNMKEAKSLAQLQKRNIFVYIGADWCAPCKQVKKYTFTNEEIINKLDSNYVCLQYMDETHEKEISKLGVNFFPSFLILDISGNELYRKIGSMWANDMLVWLDIEEKSKTLAILGTEKFKEYQELSSLAKQLQLYGRYQSALNTYEKQLGILPDDKDTYESMAQVYLNFNKPQQSIDYYNKALKAGAKLTKYNISNIINAYLQLMEDSKLIDWFKSIMLQYKNDKKTLSIIYLSYSECLEVLQKNHEAIEAAEQSINENPENSDAHIQLGRLYYLNNELDKAKKHLLCAKGMDEKNPLSCFYNGLVASREGNNADVEKCLESAKERSTWVAGKVLKGHYSRRNNYKKYPGYLILIEQGIRYALMLETDNAFYFNLLASFLADENKNLDEAMTNIDKAITMEPENGAFFDTKAWIVYRLGKYEEAKTLIAKVESLISEEEIEKSIEYCYHFGVINEAVGEIRSANLYYEILLEIPEASGFERELQDEVRVRMKNIKNN